MRKGAIQTRLGKEGVEGGGGRERERESCLSKSVLSQPVQSITLGPYSGHPPSPTPLLSHVRDQSQGFQMPVHLDLHMNWHYDIL